MRFQGSCSGSGVRAWVGQGPSARGDTGMQGATAGRAAAAVPGRRRRYRTSPPALTWASSKCGGGQVWKVRTSSWKSTRSRRPKPCTQEAGQERGHSDETTPRVWPARCQASALTACTRNFKSGRRAEAQRAGRRCSAAGAPGCLARLREEALGDAQLVHDCAGDGRQAAVEWISLQQVIRPSAWQACATRWRCDTCAASRAAR